MNCIVCKSPALKLFEAFEPLPRVGSDSRPLPSGGRLGQCGQCGAVQKPMDDEFRAECEAIYSSYVMYAQSDQGAEPKVFDARPCGRSTRLVEVVKDEMDLAETGSLLDVGCGNGNLLRAFKSVRPGWSLAGLEWDDRHRESVENICSGGSLLTGELANVDGRFDVITAVHVLEHLVDPTEFLVQAKERLTSGGVVVIQLPLWRRNPFDLVVADHAVHYDGPTLLRVLHQAGFSPIFVSEEAVPRELIVIARFGEDAGVELGGAEGSLDATLGWFATVRDDASRAMDEVGKDNFGVFGTGNAAMWLTEALGGVGFYVDDDPSRQGINVMTDCPVYGPDGVPEGATVVICLPPELSAQVFERVRALPVNWLATPPLEK